jgi:hypothetical protein
MRIRFFIECGSHTLNSIKRLSFERGDKADKAIILHAHKVVHKIIKFLQQELNVVKLDGVTIKELYQLCEKDSRASSDEIDIAKIAIGEQINKE